MSFGTVYPLYVTKAERKGRSKDELDQVIVWLTGYSGKELETVVSDGTDFEAFFQKAPSMNEVRFQVTGNICGVRVETIEDPTMRDIRILDKLVDELAKGKSLEKILRS